MNSLQTAIETYRRALPPGELIPIELTPFDRLGVPNQSVMFFAHAGRTHGGTGYGFSPDAALVSSLGEACEEFFASQNVARRPLVEGSYAQMREKHGPRGVCDPLTLCLEAGSDYDENRVLRWAQTRRLGSEETVWVPLEWVATSRPDAATGGYQPLITPITNGLGAGLSREAAIAHGLLELLQRDGNGLQIRALASTSAIDPASVSDPQARQLLDGFERAGIEVRVKVASTEFGFVNLYVVGVDRDGQAGLPLTAAAGGEAAHPVAQVALRKALLEWAASRSRIAFMHGPMERVAELAPPGYVQRMRAGFRPEKEESRSLAAMKNWIGLSLQEVRELMQPALRVEKWVAFDELPSAPAALNDDSIALAASVAQRLQSEGFDVLVADFASVEEEGIAALKVIVPGLEVETLSYGRIGERNVRRLMARPELGIAGIGDAPASAKTVLLTPEAQERLGGRAWFDPQAVLRAMGPLYCLYREPGRHSAPLAREMESAGAIGL